MFWPFSRRTYYDVKRIKIYLWPLNSWSSNGSYYWSAWKNKPIQSIFERYVQLEACKYVDEIVVYATEKELLDILHSYPINIRIVGDEYKDKDFTGKELLHIEMYYNFRKHSFSTKELRMRVIEKYKLEKKKWESYF